MSFKDILNQEIAKKILKAAVRENKVHNSYLFFGPEGCGKKDMALEFAKFLNCLEKESDEPCDKCASCKKIIKNVHPDVMWVAASGVKQAIGIDAIREVGHFTQFKSFEAKYKVVLLERPEKLTKQAGNCFLKTLEEPPRDVVIILLTAFPDKILPTIVSRCQKIKFLALSSYTGIEIVKNRFGLDEDKSHILYFVCAGKLKWINLWEQIPLWKIRGEIFEVLINESLKEKKNYGAPLSLAESIMKTVTDFADKTKREKQDSINELGENLSSAQIKTFKALKQAETEELKKEVIKIIFVITKSFYADIFSIISEAGFIINRDKEVLLKKHATRFSKARLNDIIKEIEKNGVFLGSVANLHLIFQTMCINLFCGGN